jgi:hypothetical protein
MQTALVGTPNQDTSLHCIVCQTADHISMMPLTYNTLVVGWVYTCDKCTVVMSSRVLHYSFVQQEITLDGE